MSQGSDQGTADILIPVRNNYPGTRVLLECIYRHTEYPGGIRSHSASKLRKEKPQELIRLAVKGMLPKNRLGRKLVTKLKVYAGSEHPHEAQRPQPLTLDS